MTATGINSTEAAHLEGPADLVDPRVDRRAGQPRPDHLVPDSPQRQWTERLGNRRPVEPTEWLKRGLDVVQLVGRATVAVAIVPLRVLPVGQQDLIDRR